jgi:sugar diacid utilization regulator
MSTETSIIEKLRLYEQNMNINNNYFVAILEADEDYNDLDWIQLRSYLYKILHRERCEYVTTIMAPGRLIVILKGKPRGSPMDANPDWPGRDKLQANKDALDKKFNTTTSLGLGRVYRPSELVRSYREACIALALSRLTGETQVIKYFSQLGIFTILFSHDTETVKNYCLRILGKVINYDEKNGTDFLGTLRILLDNACSWTTTADQLYVHVNTVYYRMLKVEQLLDINFSSFDTRLDLFTAVRAWDILQACQLLD